MNYQSASWWLGYGRCKGYKTGDGRELEVCLSNQQIVQDGGLVMVINCLQPGCCVVYDTIRKLVDDCVMTH